MVKGMLRRSAPLDRVFQALADSTRRATIERLVGGPESVSELAREHAMSLQAVMQHLHVLEVCGLVKTEKAGRVRTCYLEPALLRAAEVWVVRQRTGWERRLDRLGDQLTEDAPGATNEHEHRRRP